MCYSHPCRKTKIAFRPKSSQIYMHRTCWSCLSLSHSWEPNPSGIKQLTQGFTEPTEELGTELGSLWQVFKTVLTSCDQTLVCHEGRAALWFWEQGCPAELLPRRCLWNSKCCAVKQVVRTPVTEERTPWRCTLPVPWRGGNGPCWFRLLPSNTGKTYFVFHGKQACNAGW